MYPFGLIHAGSYKIYSLRLLVCKAFGQRLKLPAIGVLNTGLVLVCAIFLNYSIGLNKNLMLLACFSSALLKYGFTGLMPCKALLD